MEETVKQLEKQMEETDQTLDSLATKVGNVHRAICKEETAIEVHQLLKSVHDVKNDYQNLRREISEVQDLQKQLSSSLQVQRRLMQNKFSLLKQRLLMNVPNQKHLGVVPHIVVSHANATDSALPPKTVRGGD